MRFSIRSLLACICMSIMLAACGEAARNGQTTAPAAAPATTSGDSTVQTKTVDGLTIALEAPASPKLLDTASFLITLTDASNTPVEGADVYLELLMPEMPMGTNKPVASPEGSGTYRAQGVFDMIGQWHVTVHANVQGKDHSAMFLSDVTEKK